MGSLSFRYDDELKRELDFIQSMLHSTQTDAIKNAIHAYYEHLYEQKQQQSSIKVLKKSGFIGCVESEETDVSISYKERLSKSLRRKHGIKK